MIFLWKLYLVKFFSVFRGQPGIIPFFLRKKKHFLLTFKSSLDFIVLHLLFSPFFWFQFISNFSCMVLTNYGFDFELLLKSLLFGLSSFSFKCWWIWRMIYNLSTFLSFFQFHQLLIPDSSLRNVNLEFNNLSVISVMLSIIHTKTKIRRPFFIYHFSLNKFRFSYFIKHVLIEKSSLKQWSVFLSTFVLILFFNVSTNNFTQENALFSEFILFLIL
jgi:hypothetical protein